MAGALYRAALAADCRSVAIEGFRILYHRPSGQTHVLSAPAPMLLDLLADGPASLRQILAALEVDPADAEIADAVEIRLGELEEVGLVRRA